MPPARFAARQAILESLAQLRATGGRLPEPAPDANPLALCTALLEENRHGLPLP